MVNSKTKFAGTNTLRMIKEFIDTQESPVTAYFVRTRLVLNRKINLDALKFLSDYGLIKKIESKSVCGTVSKYFGINKMTPKKSRQIVKANKINVALEQLEDEGYYLGVDMAKGEEWTIY